MSSLVSQSGKSLPFWVNIRKTPVSLSSFLSNHKIARARQSTPKYVGEMTIHQVASQLGWRKRPFTLSWFSVVNPEPRNCYTPVSISGLFNCYRDLWYLSTNSTVETGTSRKGSFTHEIENRPYKIWTVQGGRVGESSKDYECQNKQITKVKYKLYKHT